MPMKKSSFQIRASIVLLVMLGMVSAACAVAEESRDVPAGRESPEPFSLTAVVANAERFDGREITTFGYYISGEERSALCPSREVASTSECILLLTDGSDSVSLANLEGRSLMVMGKFAARQSGSSSFYAGRILAWRVTTIPEVKNSP